MSEETRANESERWSVSLPYTNARHKWPSSKDMEGNRYDQLPTSFLHNSLISLLPVQQSDDSGGISCGLCNKKGVETSLPIVSTAKSFCVVDCENALELFRVTRSQDTT